MIMILQNRSILTKFNPSKWWFPNLIKRNKIWILMKKFKEVANQYHNQSIFPMPRILLVKISVA